ncbi:hypothetical protein IKF89_01265 [Candidatus Saccharibacteria bacterium]|nr:hypothetical protein [Candidatus Saccharibacteria bacterium]
MENEINEVRAEKRDTAKVKIILFVIGVLVGAVVSTAAFFVYTQTLNTSSNSNGNSMQMPGGGTPPEMPSGDNSGNGQSGTPPEKPSNDSNSSQSSDN